MQSEVKQIEISIEDLKAKIALADALDTLHKSTAFKKVMVKGYFEDRAIELARSASQVCINENSAIIHKNALIAISGVQAYFHAIYVEAAEAKEALSVYEEELVGARADG